MSATTGNRLRQTIMNEHRTEDLDLPRFTCVSYCRCETRKGHFVKEPDGVWVRFADVEKLLDGALVHVARGSVELTGLSWQLRAAGRATNQDLRAIASLLTAAAYKLEQNPEAVDTRIEA